MGNTMRGFYGLVKYVPNPARGEGINIGLVLASENKQLMLARFRDRFPSSKDLGYLIPDEKTVKSFANNLKKDIELNEFSHDLANSIQISELRPCIFESAEKFADDLFRDLVAPPHSVRIEAT